MSNELKEKEIRWLIEKLRKISFFSNVNLDTIDKVISLFILKSFKKGSVLIKQDSVGEAFYIIKSGSCLVYRKKGLFFIKKIAELKEGDFFGEMSLVNNDKTSASVKCLEDSELFVITKKSFLELLDNNNELRKEIEFIADKRKFENK